MEENYQWSVASILEQAIAKTAASMALDSSVVDWDHRIKLIWDDMEILGEVISISEENDVAVVKLDETGLMVEVSASTIVDALKKTLSSSVGFSANKD